MKRRLLIIVLFLLLGAATTVAVCWASASRPLPRTWSFSAQEGYSGIYGGGIWNVYRTDRFARVRLRSTWIFEWAGSLADVTNLLPARNLLPYWSANVARLEPGGVNSAEVIVEGTGWPLVAMLAHYQLDPGLHVKPWSYSILSPAGILIGDSPSDGWSAHGQRILPIRIVWFGFVIDTIALGALLWPVVCGPAALRRLWRASRARRRGLCPRCAYPIGDSSVCTECGTTLPHRRRMANLS